MSFAMIAATKAIVPEESVTRMVPYKSYRPMAVPQTWQARIEIAKAICALAVEDKNIKFRRRRTDIAAIRRDLEQLVQDVRRACDEWPSPQRSDLKKYSPDQPRVPAGGPDGGQWTSEGGSGSSGGSGVELAQNKVTPQGFTVQQVPGQDPLDPEGLNTPISADEQQKIADALTLVVNGDIRALQPHAYGNLPHRVTGAVLPASTAGYTAYDVPGLGVGRGEGRLLVDNATGAIYYTNNHYYSFYPIQVHPRGE
jgi:hypothetical protein